MRGEQGGRPVLHMRRECQCVHIPVSAHSPCLQLRSLWKPFPRLCNVPEWKENSREGQKKSLMHITKTEPRKQRKKGRRSQTHTFILPYLTNDCCFYVAQLSRTLCGSFQGCHTSVKKNILHAKLNFRYRINNIK